MTSPIQVQSAVFPACAGAKVRGEVIAFFDSKGRDQTSKLITLFLFRLQRSRLTQNLLTKSNSSFRLPLSKNGRLLSPPRQKRSRPTTLKDTPSVCILYHKCSLKVCLERIQGRIGRAGFSQCSFCVKTDVATNLMGIFSFAAGAYFACSLGIFNAAKHWHIRLNILVMQNKFLF